MPRDTDILRRLREAGLKVVEVDGWRTRGSETFNPRGSVDHHTAGAARGNAPSLGICINGRADLPGPLCHILIARDLTCYLIAAGRANHAGKGGFKGLSGNSSVYGVERENVGTPEEPWRLQQTEHAARVHRALIDGRASALYVCRHAEWAPTRKIDTHSLSGATLRVLVARVEPKPEPEPTPKPPEEKDDVRHLVRAIDGPLKGRWYETDGLTKRHVTDRLEARVHVNSGLCTAKGSDSNGDPIPHDWPAASVEGPVEIRHPETPS